MAHVHNTTTAFRLTQSLRAAAEEAARKQGMSYAEFMRAATRRAIQEPASLALEHA